MRVRVGVRDKLLDIQIGPGTQSLLWLANAALCRYDSTGLTGPPLGLRLDDGTQLPLEQPIADYLVDGGQVFVVLAREEAEEEEEAARAAEDREEEGEGGAGGGGGGGGGEGDDGDEQQDEDA